VHVPALSDAAETAGDRLRRLRGGGRASTVPFESGAEDLTLSLITSGLFLNQDWEFHPADRDHMPSMPHGHGLTDRDARLDPYRNQITYKEVEEADGSRIQERNWTSLVK